MDAFVANASILSYSVNVKIIFWRISNEDRSYEVAKTSFRNTEKAVRYTEKDLRKIRLKLVYIAFLISNKILTHSRSFCL